MLLSGRSKDHPAGERGMTTFEIAVAIPILGLILMLSVMAVTRYMAQRTLLGWSDIVENDIHAAQQVAIARRAAVTMTFTPKAGSTPASYSVSTATGTIRSQTLPSELTFGSQSVQFSTVGIPSSTAAVAIQLTDSIVGTSRTITVNPVTGSLTVQ
jgi:hypothetical protein